MFDFFLMGASFLWAIAVTKDTGLFYQDMRAEAEQQVYERLNMKIEEFLELGAYK